MTNKIRASIIRFQVRRAVRALIRGDLSGFKNRLHSIRAVARFERLAKRRERA